MSKVLTTIVSMAGSVDPSLKKAFDDVQKRLEGVDVKAVAVTASMVASFAAVTTGVVKVSKELITFGDEYNGVMLDLQAKTGATSDEMDSLSNTISNIYKSNLGEDWQDIADTVAVAKQNTGLMDEDLQNISSDALILRDTFDYDVTESLRAAKAMMTNFGTSGEEAMNYIAEGTQNGLNFSGELIDSINEYSVHFKKVGFDANEFFNIMELGAENGAWNIDKIGDAVKEFSIRAIDGSDTTKTAFGALGYDANEVMSIFANGGENANIAFKQIMQDIIAVEDGVKRDAIGVQLFGTMWEDLGIDAISAMAGVTNEAYLTGDALGEINDIKYNTISQAIEGIKRQFEVGLAPVASEVATKLNENMPLISEKINELIPVVQNLAIGFADNLVPTIDSAISALQWCANNTDILKGAAITLAAVYGMFTVSNLITAMTSMVNVFGMLSIAKLKDKAETLYLMGLYAKDAVARGLSTAATTAQTVATSAWNVVAAIGTGVTTAFGAAIAFLTSPIGLVILAIGALIGIGVLLYKNWDTVKMYASQLGSFLSTTWENIKLSVGNFIQGIQQSFLNGFSSLVGIIKAPINSVISLINGAIGGINTIGFDVPEWVPLIGGNKFSVNIPTLPMLAKGGFTNGVSIAGEAGTEAVISFDPSVRSENISYWAKAGQMLGALPDNASPLMDNTYGSNNVSIGQINFSPKIEIAGNANKQDVMAAIEAEYPEFIDLLERWFAERGYFAYGY